MSIDLITRGVDHELGDSGTLTLRTEDGERRLGGGEPDTVVEVSGYELFRALFGRRSPAQLASWTWSGPSERYLTLLARLDQTERDLTD